jgi:hypothetical protein
MQLKASVEHWKEGLSPENTIQAWSTAATTSVILAVLIDDEIERKGGLTLDLSPKEDGEQ